MLLHRLFSVFLCAHYDQEQDGAILELLYPDDQSTEIVLCKVFYKGDGICSCVSGRQRIISPKLSLDPRTLLGKVQIDANGWLGKADTFHQGPAAIPDIERAARTSQGLSGPVSVYFVLQLEITMPSPLYQLELTFALGSNYTLFSFDKDRHSTILDVQNTVGVDICIMSNKFVEVGLRCDGWGTKGIIPREKLDTSVWSLDLGVFIDFRNKQIAYVNVKRSAVILRQQLIEKSQLLFSLLKVRSRVRISSGKEVHISREIKSLLLRNIR